MWTFIWNIDLSWLLGCIRQASVSVSGTHIWNVIAQDRNNTFDAKRLEWNQGAYHDTLKPQHPELDPGLGLLRQDTLSISLPTFPVEPANYLRKEKFINCNSQMWILWLKSESERMRHYAHIKLKAKKSSGSGSSVLPWGWFSSRSGAFSHITWYSAENFWLLSGLLGS